MAEFERLSRREKEARLGLHQIPGIGASLANRLLDHFGDAVAIFGADEATLRQLAGIGEALTTRLLEGYDPTVAARQLTAIERHGLRVVCSDDPAYPAGFQRLHNPPYMIFCAGEWPDEPTPPNQLVALVGTRRPDQRGIQLTREATVGLLQRGFTIVSGGALGIDTTAHVTALTHQGRTIAVLAHGLDQAYPSQNRGLFQRIREQGGALLSEFGPGIRPERGYFPRRNRLISGLCGGVVVVQCGAKSGALNTADHARRANIPVMAFPGRPQEQLAAGPHQLLRRGAHLVESGADIAAHIQGQSQPEAQLELWGQMNPAATAANGEGAGGTDKKVTSFNSHVVTIEPSVATTTPLTTEGASLDPPSQAVLAQLDVSTPKHIDELAQCAALPIARVTACLLQLELEGWVQAHPGMHFTRF